MLLFLKRISIGFNCREIVIPIMILKDLKNCEEFIAGDNSHLRELLHPGKEDLAIRYSLAHAVVKPGQVTRSHSLKNSEVYYILKGNGVMHINGESANVRPGQAVYIPPGSRQYIRNTGESDLIFLCIVDPAWRPEDEEVFS
jgi:mannose-6-phosphate isomerase-like protein (cupin superfamily)